METIRLILKGIIQPITVSLVRQLSNPSNWRTHVFGIIQAYIKLLESELNLLESQLKLLESQLNKFSLSVYELPTPMD